MQLNLRSFAIIITLRVEFVHLVELVVRLVELDLEVVNFLPEVSNIAFRLYRGHSVRYVRTI
jgi:hypothetical protein